MRPILGSWVDTGRNALAIVCGLCAGSLLILLAGWVTALTLLRVFSAGISGGDEVAGYLLVATVYLGLPWAAHEGGLIRLALLSDRVPRSARIYLTMLVLTIATVTTALIAYHGWGLALTSYKLDIESVGSLRMPVAVPQFSMAIGITLLSMQSLLMLLSAVLNGSDPMANTATPEAFQV